jgi:hypothetical protein
MTYSSCFCARYRFDFLKAVEEALPYVMHARARLIKTCIEANQVKFPWINGNIMLFAMRGICYVIH